MPSLKHPRDGIMNHQPEGPTCFMSCVVAVREYDLGKVIKSPDGRNIVKVEYENFMRYHAAATTPPNYTKHALGQLYEKEERLSKDTKTGNVLSTIREEISNGRPLLCGIQKKGAQYGHLFMIYGYDEKETVLIADPIIGKTKMPIDELKQGYNGYQDYHWTKLIYTNATP